VLEIYSATLHTKYTGFHTKQIYWIGAGLVAMFVVSLIDYHKLIDFVPWAMAYSWFLWWRSNCWREGPGARRWIRLATCNFSRRSG